MGPKKQSKFASIQALALSVHGAPDAFEEIKEAPATQDLARNAREAESSIANQLRANASCVDLPDEIFKKWSGFSDSDEPCLNDESHRAVLVAALESVLSNKQSSINEQIFHHHLLQIPEVRKIFARRLSFILSGRFGVAWKQSKLGESDAKSGLFQVFANTVTMFGRRRYSENVLLWLGETGDPMQRKDALTEKIQSAADEVIEAEQNNILAAR